MRVLKIYVAAPWVHKPDAIEAGRRLESWGFEVTSNWFYHNDNGNPNDSAGLTHDRDAIIRQAIEDIADVRRADILLVLNLAKSEGKAVETGIAIAAEIPIISVGVRSNIFQTLGAEVDTLDDAIVLLLHLDNMTAVLT